MFARVGARTALTASYSGLPLQVQRPIQRPDGGAVLTLLTPGAALFDGDAIELTVECGAGTDVTLRQTGATRLHRCEGTGIRLAATIHAAAGARFRYLPYELIPYAGASYRHEVRLDLEAGAEALLVEVLSPGRLGEHFAYAHLRLRTEVWLDGTLVALDGLDLQPARMDCAALLGGFTHLGTLLWLAPDADQAAADALHADLATHGICGSASLLPAYGLASRALGRSAAELLAALHGAVGM